MARFIPGFVTDLIGRTRRNRFGAWRWYSPATVCFESGDECLPHSLVPKLLLLCGSARVEDLMRELEGAERHSIPPKLRRRLLRMFESNAVQPEMLDDPEFMDPEFSPWRPIGLTVAGTEIACPFPCKPVLRPRAQLDLSELTITLGDTFLKVGGRVGIHTNNFLAPCTAADVEFCDRFLLGNASCEEDMNARERDVLAGWLCRGGLPKRAAVQACEDPDLRTEITVEIRNRIEEVVEGLIDVGVAEDLHDNGRTLMINGDQECGFDR
jgi:hypothetical protein